MEFEIRTYEELEREHARLIRAVASIYYGAHWTPDRPVDEASLWTELRDAAGFEPGKAPKS
jgi:hypothetical protein